MAAVGVSNSAARILTMTESVQCVASNVHVSIIEVCGVIAKPNAGGILDPINMAKKYYQVATEADKSKWQPEHFIVTPQFEPFLGIQVKNMQ